MATPASLVFTVTNQLVTDQRMQRICTSLASQGHRVLLVGSRFRHTNAALAAQPFAQKRLFCLFHKGPLFYIEFNVKLFVFLLFSRWNLVCAIDLDTILPCLWASQWLGRKRVYDAHELFTEMQELRRRPMIHRLWLGIEKYAVPRYKLGYTVNDFIAQELKNRYGVQYAVIRNLPVQKQYAPAPDPAGPPFLLYQGAVNEGRSFETLIPAMQLIDMPLHICGDGNLMTQVQQWVQQYGVANKVIFKGVMAPAHLQKLTPMAFAGITIFQKEGWNQYYSLANRFFDYMMAGIPQICVDYPEYKAINDVYDFALMIPDVAPETIATAVNKLQTDAVVYRRLQSNARKAGMVLHWQAEQIQLQALYRQWLATE